MTAQTSKEPKVCSLCGADLCEVEAEDASDSQQGSEADK